MRRKAEKGARIFASIVCCALIWGCVHEIPPSSVETRTVSDLPAAGATQIVGFDLDDTLLFSSPAFDRAAASGAARDSSAYWELVNGSDSELSVVKPSVLEILREHQAKGDLVYVITARHPFGVEPLLEFIDARFGVPPDRVFFETEGKAQRISALGIRVFYGDSDSDIKAAQAAGARAVRILRSPESTYTWSYHPGELGEEIVEGSEN